jgi:very-short-patch-repair endonuclease
MADESARALRKRMTPQEVKLWVRLRELRVLGHHFRRQSPIPPYVADFECRRRRLIVEVDGGQHTSVQGQAGDKIRDRAFAQKGYRVLRFWNHEVDRELDAVMETILRSLGDAPHPATGAGAPTATLPEGGEG